MCCARTTDGRVDLGSPETIDRTTCCSCSSSSSRTLHWRVVRLVPLRHRHHSSILTPFSLSSSQERPSHLSTKSAWSAIDDLDPNPRSGRPPTHHVCFPRFFAGPFSNLFAFSYLILSCFILLLPSSSMASPIRSLDRVDRSVPEKPNWIDPCSLGAIDKVMNPSEEFKASVPKLNEKDLFEKIYSRSEVAKEHANKVKKDFVSIHDYFLSFIFSLNEMLGPGFLFSEFAKLFSVSSQVQRLSCQQ